MNVKKERKYAAPFAIFEKKPEGKGYLLEELEYDKEGNLLKSRRFFEDGNMDEEAEYEYDDKGRMIEERVTYALSDSTDVRKFTYDDDKKVETEIYYYGDEEGEKTLTKKNDDGETLEIRRFDDSGGLVSKEIYEYHKKGKPTLEAEYTGEGVMLKEVKSSYDENDKLIEQKVKSNDEMEIDQTLKISYEDNKEIAKAYDTQGDLLYTRTRFFNKQGNLEKFVHEDQETGSKTVQSITYDEGNNPTLVEWRTGKGDLVRKQENDYNEHGLMTREFYFDLNPITGQQSHMVTSFEYDYFE